MRKHNQWRMFVISACLGFFGMSFGAFAAPSLVNGIAMFVNGKPVTLVEVYRIQQRDKVGQDVAVDRLINEKLHEEEINKRKIVANDIEVEDEIERVAKKNKTTLAKVKSYVESNGGSWDAYKEGVRNEILKKKLYQSISQESLRTADDKEIRGYYEANRDEFMIPQSIEAVKFYSKDNNALEQVLKSNGKVIPAGVQKSNEVLQTAALNPQVVLSFAQGRVGSFTPIFPIGDEFVTFLIQSKNNPVLIPYENARNLVAQKIVQQKEDYLIYEYFEKLRSNAKVNIVRLK